MRIEVSDDGLTRTAILDPDEIRRDVARDYKNGECWTIYGCGYHRFASFAMAIGELLWCVERGVNIARFVRQKFNDTTAEWEDAPALFDKGGNREP